MTEKEKPHWKKAFAYCPLCWWALSSGQALIVWPDEFIEKAKAKHATEKPHCHETLRIEGK